MCSLCRRLSRRVRAWTQRARAPRSAAAEVVAVVVVAAAAVAGAIGESFVSCFAFCGCCVLTT